MRRIVFLTLALGIIATCSSPTIANDSRGPGVKGVGVRLGYGFDPDQVVFGAQAVYGKIFKFADLVPSFDLGLGDNMTTYTFNTDLRFLVLPLPKSSSAIYMSFGPSLTYWDPKNADPDLEIGLSVTGGVRMGIGQSGFYNLEARFGVGDVPDVRIMLGVFFGGGKKQADSGR